MWYGMTNPYQGFPAEGVFVDIPHGASRRYAAYILKKNGVIRSATAFEIYARRNPKRTLQAGEYFFDHAATGMDGFWKIVKRNVFQKPFTVGEGETMFRIRPEMGAGEFISPG